MIAIRLAPDRLGLGLNSPLGTEYGHHAVKDAHRTLYLHGKVHVSGCIYNVIRVSCHMQVVAAEVIVIPRSCSWAIQSIVAVPSCTSPSLCNLPNKIVFFR